MIPLPLVFFWGLKKELKGEKFATFNRKNSPMEWIKLHTALINKPKFKKLSATGQGILVNLWILAAQDGACGELDDDYLDPDYLFTVIGVREAERAHALEQLGLIKKLGWLDRTEDNTYIPHNWDVYQTMPKTSTERSRLCRKRKIELAATECNEASVAGNDSSVACNAPSQEERRRDQKRSEDPPLPPLGEFELSAVAEKQKKERKQTDPNAKRLAKFMLEHLVLETPSFVQPDRDKFRKWVSDMDKLLTAVQGDAARIERAVLFATHDPEQKVYYLAPCNLLNKGGLNRLEMKMNKPQAPQRSFQRAPEPQAHMRDLGETMAEVERKAKSGI
jgi:hypothetical protein